MDKQTAGHGQLHDLCHQRSLWVPGTFWWCYISRTNNNKLLLSPLHWDSPDELIPDSSEKSIHCYQDQSGYWLLSLLISFTSNHMYRNVDFPIFVFINTCLVNYEVLVNDEYRKRLFTFLFFIKVHAFHELSKLKILVTCL